ncbi:hypothetical protein BDW66DRAFT_130940 [Aspergillus desertorum]
MYLLFKGICKDITEVLLPYYSAHRIRTHSFISSCFVASDSTQNLNKPDQTLR